MRVYDRESGQFLTATFQDYCMPRAGDAPDFDLGFNIVPCPNNDLGVKGAGEGGACGAPPAIVSAICDALGVGAYRHAGDAGEGVAGARPARQAA